MDMSEALPTTQQALSVVLVVVLVALVGADVVAVEEDRGHEALRRR